MSDPVYVYIGAFDNDKAANADLAVVHDLYADDANCTYDAAVVSKKTDGRVHVRRHEERTARAAWNGAGVGALVGILTPRGLLHSAAIGAATSGLISHFRDGLSRRELKELGEALDAGQANLVILSTAEFDQAFTAGLKATRHTIKQLDEADAGELARELHSVPAD